MNRDDVIRMAREAGIPFYDQYDRQHEVESLDKFAHLIASHVAEECAKTCENRKIDGLLVHSNAVMNCAAAIRSLYKPTA